MKKRRRPPCVVDTNVAVVANGDHPDPACAAVCARELAEVRERGHVVVDDGYRIVKEYQRNLHDAGQPGPGHIFLRWLLSNLGNRSVCSQVRITADPSDPENFSEFSPAMELRDFDPADRKFVAVAATHPKRPCILQATDSKWWGWKDALAAAGIEVKFLCPATIKAKYERKVRRRCS